MVDGVRVVVPDTLKQLTTYSLVEQQDWFEEEIKFLRKLLKPGQRAIDIGASYGLYTLSMAKCVGSSGRIWAFEPVSSTASMLAESLVANGFSHVSVEQKALSNVCGSARMSLNQHSECNAILRNEASVASTELVSTTTLDDCLTTFQWQDISFVKIDAEGEESWILQGGAQFFEKLSPLVQFELKEGSELRLDLVEQYASLGYRSYRLVPGLDLLVPFDANAPIDSYNLNLFCCKQDRADELAKNGNLLRSTDTTVELHRQVIETARAQRDYDWRRRLTKLPYGTRLEKIWKSTVDKGESGEVCDGLALFAMSRDGSRSPAERYIALQAALQRFTKLCEIKPKHLRLSSLARIANEYGARTRAVQSLWQLCHSIAQNRRADLSEPFLAPIARFDSIEPGEAVGSWMIAAATEAYERKSSFSSFYTGSKALERLSTISDLGFGDEEMKRRLFLVRRCIEEFGETKS